MKENKKIVIAPDSFKESMTAIEACVAIDKAIHDYDSTIQTKLIPLADGGEGTLDTLIYAMSGKIEEYQVTGPLFEKITAPIGYVNDMAIIECAKVCGLELLNEDQKNPSHTTTYGLGELISIAIKQQVKKIMLCLGGSATNDGGIGMLAALGVRFFNAQGNPVTLTMAGLKDITHFDTTHMLQFHDIEMVAVCDVTNPLCGKNGATYVYAPQKGLPLKDLSAIDQDMENYAKLVDSSLHKDYRFLPGAGAAGGLGYALVAFLSTQLLPGFEIVSQVVDLEKWIQWCDAVIVGEGKIDCQTQFGKTPYGVLKLSQKYHKNVFALAGQLADYEVLQALGFKELYAITPTQMPLSLALKKGSQNLYECVKQKMEDMMNAI